MPHLTYSQIEEVWIQAGGSRTLAPIMAAISMAESGGNYGTPNSINDNPSTEDYSVGLWQINYFGSLRQSRIQAYGTPEQLNNDPLANARAAVDLARNGAGLGNWTTYTSGVYQSFLSGSTPPATGPIPGGGGGGTGTETNFPIPTGPNPFSIIGGIGEMLHGDIWGGLLKGSGLEGQGFNPLDGIASAIATTFSFITGLTWFLHPENWLRIVSGMTGVIVLGFAIYLVSTAS